MKRSSSICRCRLHRRARGFAYVPAGEFWFGDADEQLRTQFLDTVPLHRRPPTAISSRATRRRSPSGSHFLTRCPRRSRRASCPTRRRPARLAAAAQAASGGWQSRFSPRPSVTAREAASRSSTPGGSRAAPGLARFPVAGVSPVDAHRYIAWLRDDGARAGRAAVHRARVGAGRARRRRSAVSARRRARREDANFDLTYGRLGSAYGPDVVGSHATSRSPFGVDDLAGNVFELALSSQEPTRW